MKDESSRFIGTVLEYEAPFEAVKNTLATTISTESKSSDSRHETNNEKNEKVFINTSQNTPHFQFIYLILILLF